MDPSESDREMPEVVGGYLASDLCSDLVRAAVRASASEEPQLPGAVRASIGIGVQPHHIDRLVSALSGLQTQ